jgi:polyisoprenoid-binding protein YceI
MHASLDSHSSDRSSSSTVSRRETWSVDASHSSVGFVARHMLISKVHGTFKSFDGRLELDESDLTRSAIEVTIDATSVDTAEPKRDAHLRSADFFDVEKYPSLTFRSSQIEKRGDGFAVTGDLTIHGVTREVVLDVNLEGRGKDPWGGERIAFTARTSVRREDFGLTWNQLLETGGVLVSSKIDIELDVQAVKAKSA